MQEVLNGLNQRFGNAHLVMEWLSQAARQIASAGEVVQWTTPMGLPVVQEYYKAVSFLNNCSQPGLSVPDDL